VSKLDSTEEMCCPRKDIHLCLPTQSTMCCSGKVYIPQGEDCECCDGATEENPTQVVVSAVGAPDGQKACCGIETYGANPTAYWTGSSVQCCAGEAKPKLDGSGYVCCPVVETCPDGQEPTDNYVDGVGLCGKVCCEKKEDYENTYINEGLTHTDYRGDYTIVGATNGACCAGYKKDEFLCDGQDCPAKEGADRDYQVLENGGTYYCAISYTGYHCWFEDDCDYHFEATRYLSSSKYCRYYVDEGCLCSSKGDPQNGSWCGYPPDGDECQSDPSLEGCN